MMRLHGDPNSDQQHYGTVKNLFTGPRIHSSPMLLKIYIFLIFVNFVSGKSSSTCFLKSRPSSLAWQLWSRLCRVIFTTFTGNLYTFIQRSLALMLRRWRRTCEINVRRCLSQTQNFFMATRRKCPLSWVPNKGTQWNELTACLFFCGIHSSKILLTDIISFLIRWDKKKIFSTFVFL